MKTAAFVSSLLLASSAYSSPVGDRVEAWVWLNHPELVSELRYSAKTRAGWTIIEAWSLGDVPAPSPDELMSVTGAQIEAYSAAREVLADAAAQAAKSPRLKAAERKLIDFLRAEGAIAADAVSATPEQVNAMYETWEATLNDAQIDKKSTKYTRLLERVERAGGTEAGAYRHAD